jgi:RNA polymerase sigma-70 factor (ECF subfamily)
MGDVTPQLVASGERTGSKAPGSGWRRSGKAQGPASAQRVRSIVDAHFDFIWRLLRRLGVPSHAADDAAQQVFLVAAGKIGTVVPEKERSFLFAIALRVAAEEWRTRKRRRELAASDSLSRVQDAAPDVEQLLDRSRARGLLEQILASMPLDQRAVFVLYEMEELTTAQIAELLQIPLGTVASRLRRGRELYQEAVDRLKARAAWAGA